jgi:hypothetical protein
VREGILDAGHTAARSLERWEPALVLNAEIIALTGARHAPTLATDGVRFRELFARLPTGRAASGDDALRRVLDCLNR